MKGGTWDGSAFTPLLVYASPREQRRFPGGGRGGGGGGGGGGDAKITYMGPPGGPTRCK